MGRGRGTAADGVGVARRRRLPLRVNEAAEAEFLGHLRRIARESPAGARSVLEAVNKRVRQLRRYPEAAPAEEATLVLPTRTRVRRAHAKGFIIRYLYPFPFRQGSGVLVASLRPGGMQPDDVAFYRRYVEEYAREVRRSSLLGRPVPHDAPSMRERAVREARR